MYRVIPDERPLIEETLKELCDKEGCCLVVTTGGTGPAPRDVTPEATEAVRRPCLTARADPTAHSSPKAARLCGDSAAVHAPIMWHPVHGAGV